MNFCPNCGQPIDPITGRCPVCSSKQTGEQYPTADYTQYNTLDNYGGSFTAFLKKRLSSPVFLWFCIILTVSMVAAMAVYVIEAVNMPRLIEMQLSTAEPFASPDAARISSRTAILWMGIFGIPLLAYIIVMIVSFWKTYFGAKNPSLDMPLGGLKAISVLITIERVLIWIAVGIIAVLMIIMFAMPSLMVSDISGNDYEFFILFFYVYAVFMVFIIVLLVLLNIFFYGSIKKAIVSVINSFRFNENRLEKMGTVKVWLIVFGVLSGLSALSFSATIPMLYSMTAIPGFSEIPIESFTFFSPVLMVVAVIATLCAVALYFLGATIASRLNIPKQQPPVTYIYSDNT